MSNQIQSSNLQILSIRISHLFDRQVPRKPCLLGGVKVHIEKDISFARILLATACPGSPGLWPGTFTFGF